MKIKIDVTLFAFAFLCLLGFSERSFSATGYGCGSLCMAQLYGNCPTCGPGFGNGYGMNTPRLMPWGTPSPYYWQTGPMIYNNFYAPGPWYYPGSGYQGYYSPGVMPNYFPGNGPVFAAKPNLYVIGPAGTKVSVKITLKEEGANWLATVPSHGTQGWQVTLAKGDRVTADDATYGYLYSDYRIFDKQLQDEVGFCADKKITLAKMADYMKKSDFSAREIAHFLEYWSVKLPKSEGYCVYPQDERQLEKVAPLDVSPTPAAVRRILFLVQVKEGLSDKGGKFTRRPLKEWSPQGIRIPASNSKAIIVREWGVGFLAAKK